MTIRPEEAQRAFDEQRKILATVLNSYYRYATLWIFGCICHQLCHLVYVS